MSSITSPASAVNGSREFDQLVLEEEARMIREDGWNVVNGRFIPKALNADYFRHIEATKRVETRLRKAEWLNAHPCCWCGRTIGMDERVELVSGGPIHGTNCLPALDEFLYGKAA